MTLSTGLHRIDAETYHRDPCEVPSLSSTLAKHLLNQSPLHAWTNCARLNPAWEPVEKATFDLGSAAHTAALGAGQPYAVYPEDLLGANGAVSTKAAKEWAQEQRDKGATPIKADVAEVIEAMVESLYDRLDALNICLMHDQSEVAAIGEIEGTWCRALIDNAPADPTLPLYDFKTCESAAPDACTRAVMNYGYDIQAAHYLETWKAATGEDRRFRFIFQEKSAPFEVCVIELHEDSLTMARKKTRRAREVWRNCVASDHWPGYPPGVNVIDLPAWFQERWLQQEIREADFKAAAGHDILDAARRWQAPEHHAAE